MNRARGARDARPAPARPPSTAINTAYFAESVATFAIVMGFALLLTGIGFLVLTVRVLGPAAARPQAVRGTSAVPTTG